MQEEIKVKFPKWCEDIQEGKYECVLSDDIDSLMCAVFQEVRFNNKVKWFFYSDNTSKTTQRCYKVKDHKLEKEILGLDIALEGNNKTWDNHVVKVSSTDTYNKNSANINIALDISRNNYTKKACVSSFITMLSYYNVDIQKWSKEQLLVLCAIDGLYYPFNDNSNFEKQGTKNLELLGYEFLVDFIKENLPDIKKTKDKLRLEEKIYINRDGKLETKIKLDELSKIFGIEIKLSDETFIEVTTLTKGFDRISKETLIDRLKSQNKKLFNLALVRRDFYVYSYL